MEANASLPLAKVIAGRLLLRALLLAPELFNIETIEPGAEEAPRGMHRNNVAYLRRLRLVTSSSYKLLPLGRGR